MCRNKFLLSAIILGMAVSFTACSSNDTVSTIEYAVPSDTDNQVSSVVQENSNVVVSEKMIDPFDGLEVTYTGTAPYISVSLDTSKCSDEVNEYVTFTADKNSNLRNGDTFTVTAALHKKTAFAFSYGSSSSDEEFTLSQDTKTFTVANQPEYVTSLDGLDLTAIQSELDDKLSVAAATNERDYRFAGVDIHGYFTSVQSKTLKSKYLLTRKRQHEDSSSVYNKYIQIYDYVVNRINSVDEPDKPTHVYVLVGMNNIASDKDKNVTWSAELSDASNDNYDSLVNDEITRWREYYNVTELK